MQNKILIYTDGATSNNGYAGAKGGWAWALIDQTENKLLLSSSGQILHNVTNNICELSAMVYGCSVAAALFKNTETEFIVCSDSAYIINCYNQKWYEKWMVNGWVNSKKQPVANKELWEQLIPFFKDSQFRFEKVKGHATDKWNQLVDKLAVEAKMNG